MPKIPMAEKAGMLRHVSDTVHMTGAPALNWKLDEGQAIADAGAKIGQGAERLGNAMMDYAVQLQETEDRLNAARIESLWKEHQSALEARMAENPASFDQFGAWAHETDDNFAEAAKPFRDKMSKRARDLFDARMGGLRKEALNNRLKLGIQARSTADYNLFQAQWKDAALRGDLETCDRLLADHRGKLISEQEYQQKKLDFGRMADEGKAQYMLDTGAPLALRTMLEAREEDGRYSHFTGLTTEQREHFKRRADAAQGKIENQQDMQVLDGFRRGFLVYPTQEAVDQALKDGDISPAQQVRYSQWLREFQKEAKRAADYQATQAEKARKATRQQQIDKFLLDTLYDENGRARSLDDAGLADARQKLARICGEDYGAFGATLSKLNAALEKKTAYRDTPLYKDGENLIAGMRAEGKLWAAGGTHWWNRDDKSYATGRYVERNLRIDLENFVQDHPQANQAELSQYLTGRLEFYHKSTLTQIAAGTLQERNLRLERKKLSDPKQPLEGAMGTYRGRRVIFTNGEWKYYAE